MKIRVGIVGLPNVGKSTLFNALAGQSVAQAENFPFCTIDPNVAPVAIPDPYLHRLGKLAGSHRTVPATIDWIDVAGLARGASRGEGLGNQFLATIRECDAICHVIRAFEDENIVHVEGRVSPNEDAEVINLELLLADLAHVDRRLDRTSRPGEERDALELVKAGLEDGIPARSIGLSDFAKFSIKSMGLLTLKPVMYTFNVDEVDFFFDREDALKNAENIVKSLQYCDPSSSTCAIISANVEAALMASPEEEQLDYLKSLGIEPTENQSSLAGVLSYHVLPLKVMELLGLSLAFTGPGVPPERSRTTRAHVYPSSKGLTAEALAGKLHGKIQRGFIRAEVVSADELLEHTSYVAAKEDGLVRIEGRDYMMNDKDVILVKWKE